MPHNFTLFETPLGSAGTAWSERGVAGVQLPEPDLAKARARLKRRFPGGVEASPPPEVRSAIREIMALLDGQPSDLSGVQLDMARVPALSQATHISTEEAVRKAQENYESKRQEYLRMVEQVREELDKAPDQYRQRFSEILEDYNKVCSQEKDRVIAAGGRLGGFSARGGLATKQRLLSIERANVSWQLPLNA